MHRLALLSMHGCPFARLGERDTGGMNIYVLQVARELGRRGYRADVFTRIHDRNDPEIVELGKNARVIHLEAGPYGETKQSLHKYIPDFLDSLSAFQKRDGTDYDLIHSHYWLSGSAAIELSRKWDVPHIATFHTLAQAKMEARPSENEPKIRIDTEYQVTKYADSIVVSTEQERDDISRFYDVNTDKIKVVPAGVDRQMFQPKDRVESRNLLGLSDTHILLAVAQRIEPLKGLDVIIEAMALMDIQEDTRLIIVGGDENSTPEVNRLTDLATGHGIADRVTFTGPVRQHQLPDYYSAADVFVFPSYYESFGLAALESQACGTPVVAANIGGPASYIKDGENGYIVPWRKPQAYADRLDALLSDNELAANMSAACRRISATMGWDVAVDQIVSHYDGLIDGKWTRSEGA